MNQPTKDILAGNLKALTDTKTLRKRTRQHVEEGVTGYAADSFRCSSFSDWRRYFGSNFFNENLEKIKKVMINATY